MTAPLSRFARLFMLALILAIAAARPAMAEGEPGEPRRGWWQRTFG